MDFSTEYQRLNESLDSVWSLWSAAYARHEYALCAELGEAYERLSIEFDNFLSTTANYQEV